MIRGNTAILGLVFGLTVLSLYFQVVAFHFERMEVREASAYEEVQLAAPETVQIAAAIDWTEERIIEEIRATFPEDPDTAVAIAKCESGLRPVIQSQHQLAYGQERSFGLMQIHAPDWHDDAMTMGLTEYRTDVQDNLAMARYIYEQAGNRFTPWSCLKLI